MTNESFRVSDPNEIIKTNVVKAGKRIYYLDVKENLKGELFLAVTESKKIVPENDGEPVRFEKHKIFIYKEDFGKFLESMTDVVDFIKDENSKRGF